MRREVQNRIHWKEEDKDRVQHFHYVTAWENGMQNDLEVEKHLVNYDESKKYLLLVCLFKSCLSF